ncbi:MAG TPA: nitrite reductase large subunit [Thiotrichaceae bacterium]|jgi:nitrite reductase (NADH) large subunit|nr:nitrite reductase large subunit [Thiotrichaceae bacterium]HIM07086.1 nitrite reductase large subunit [Gammaproteobacteria bacterium]
MSKQNLVIIGNGMVGQKFLEYMVERDEGKQFNIITFCEESRPAYDRVHLSEFFTGKTAEDLSMVEEGFFENNNITIHIGDKAVKIDLQNKQLISEKGVEIEYDKLVLATGSYPFVPPMPGHDRKDCLVYRTIEDLKQITDAGKRGKVGVVVGGGLLGLECANAVKNLGVETHVVEFAPRLMVVQIDEAGGNMLQRKIEGLGVSVHTSKNTTEIIDGETHQHKMVFADGESLETDMIVFSAGIRPRDELAKDCGLDVGQRGGIAVNNQCLTSDEDVYAIGECALWNEQIFGLVGPGNQMAAVVADHLMGTADAAFTGADMSTKLKLMGVDVCSIGDAHGSSQGSLSYSFVDEPNEIYKRIIVSEDKSKLLGSVLIGTSEEYDTLLQYALNGIDLPEHPDDLILPQRDGSGPVGLGVDALPDTAQICSCNNVSKGDLIAAIDGGAMALGDLKECTKAGTTCGGCNVMVGQVLNSELEKRGIEVNTDICEHFPYTRQDLYMLVRTEEIKTFGDLIAKHGSGSGCEVCKPAAASILASCWNEYILKNEHTQLLDTNDRFLANMQKNGTYSIVPRIAGGEITPEKLIVIGEVAKKYNLYTKITGGQRIDLFGARVDQLPPIWEELIAAGFESGHAYAKSLRTVKSCVGSTWCRFGVQDSVKMAIDMENRYKGLRAPHKFKMAVSGCTRECAEAQSKDVGIIATEKGWNLYVCGNGGMKPRHADLFASDLDDETLVKYIDRFYMFYIRTADKLQRTSTWMDNMEGGLEYLQDVIINDRLGIAEELEKEMALVINTYQCEWKTTIEDEKKMKQFRHFVNSDKTDNKVVFVQERNQIRPATTEEEQEYAETA